jgi:hypothetical protein
MGLSFESGTLSNGMRFDAVGNLPQLLKNLGPGLLRLGGNSADLSTFTGSPSRRPTRSPGCSRPLAGPRSTPRTC